MNAFFQTGNFTDIGAASSRHGRANESQGIGLSSRGSVKRHSQGAFVEHFASLIATVDLPRQATSTVPEHSGAQPQLSDAVPHASDDQYVWMDYQTEKREEEIRRAHTDHSAPARPPVADGMTWPSATIEINSEASTSADTMTDALTTKTQRSLDSAPSQVNISGQSAAQGPQRQYDALQFWPHAPVDAGTEQPPAARSVIWGASLAAGQFDLQGIDPRPGGLPTTALEGGSGTLSQVTNQSAPRPAVLRHVTLQTATALVAAAAQPAVHPANLVSAVPVDVTEPLEQAVPKPGAGTADRTNTPPETHHQNQHSADQLWTLSGSDVKHLRPQSVNKGQPTWFGNLPNGPISQRPELPVTHRQPAEIIHPERESILRSGDGDASSNLLSARVEGLSPDSRLQSSANDQTARLPIDGRQPGHLVRVTKSTNNAVNTKLDPRIQSTESMVTDTKLFVNPSGGSAQSIAADSRPASFESQDQRLSVNQHQTVPTLAPEAINARVSETQLARNEVQTTRLSLDSPPPLSISESQLGIEKQVAMTLVRHLHRHPAPHDSRLQMELDPPELGSLRIEIRWQADAGKIHIQAENVLAHQLLERNLGTLIESLQNFDMETLELDVTHRDSSDRDAWHKDRDIRDVRVMDAAVVSNTAEHPIAPTSARGQVNMMV